LSKKLSTLDIVYWVKLRPDQAGARRWFIGLADLLDVIWIFLFAPIYLPERRHDELAIAASIAVVVVCLAGAASSSRFSMFDLDQEVQMLTARKWWAIAASVSLLLSNSVASAQAPSGGPPVVGVVAAQYKPMTENTQTAGRIRARERVDLVARVTGFLNEKLFNDGSDVKKGELLYRLERAPFEADVEAKKAGVAQAQAEFDNADVALARAEALLKRSAGTEVAADNARAAHRKAVAQLQSAKAQLQQAEINLNYTEIRAPISGRIGRTLVTTGNVVGPTSGVLATIVSLDPMYVEFAISVRRVIDLRDRYATKGGFDAVQVRLRLPNGRVYNQIGKLDFYDIAIAKDTDTLLHRATIDNPVQPGTGLRDLTDDMFVSVSLEALEPQKVLAIPRGAILSDQQGNYVYVVNSDNKVEQRRVQLGQSTPDIAAVTDGLKENEKVIVEGIQRARPNLVVAPAPASLPPGRS
jgi:membrane fusion protein (multidrug efflux system)